MTALHSHSARGRPAVARRSMSKALLWAFGRHRKVDSVRLGRVLKDQGQGSFGWSILLFAVVNLLPLPLGSNVVTAIPLLVLTGQMALGFPHVRLPHFINRRRVPRRGFQRVVMRLRPLLRPVEKVIRPRHPQFFTPKAERVIGTLLFVVSAALFLPIPFSGLLSASALLVAAMGLIERDGMVTLIGLVMGAFAITVTGVAATVIVMGAQSFI